MAAERPPVSPLMDETSRESPPAARPQARKKKVIRPARVKHPLFARSEYLLFATLFAFFRALPFPLAFRIGELLGWLLYIFDRPHRRVGMVNLSLAFPEKSKAEHRAILRESLLNVGRLAAEFCHLRMLTKENIAERVRLANPEQWRALVGQCQGTGALILTGHVGNWELLAYAHAYYGFPVHIIHRRLRNPLIDEVIVRERERCGNKVIRKTTAGIEVFRALRQKAIVVAAVDQNASGRMGVFVPFFSRLASTSSGLAGLALASGVPVIPAFLVREHGSWRHRIEILPPVEPVRTGDQEADLRATTAKFTAVFQQIVEQHPDHWLWIHKRWKRRPEGEEAIY
ncbi:MAG TPA: lysophospholipid acyltransferase family protein [Methylomirabilota bacterium]|nr:lysophospholipid acyltransferase family protein [Methylomirabilota bacterium]